MIIHTLPVLGNLPMKTLVASALFVSEYTCTYIVIVTKYSVHTCTCTYIVHVHISTSCCTSECTQVLHFSQFMENPSILCVTSFHWDLP